MSTIDRVSKLLLFQLSIAGITTAIGCGSSVVVYTAQDSEFAEPVFEQFTRATQLKPATKFDVESTKTVGLVNEIIAEAQQPRCDVFWNNEILNTLRLEKLGLLEPYRSPAAEAFDAQWKSPSGMWTGFAARARILIVNKNLAGGDEKPKSIEDLTVPKWRGKIGIAKPLFGTTATQVACLFALMGDEKAKDYFRRLKANDPQILGGNKRVAEAVSAGQLAFGMTDTDDAMVEVEQGMPVEIVYPDQQPDGIGTLFIPNTVMMIKGCPHPEEAKRMIDFLLSPAAEKSLAECPSAQIPLNPNVEAKLRVETPKTMKPMRVDFQAAADKWDDAARFIRDEFATGD
jgi:iron(III) transport system substrate-binding protein